MESFFWLSNNTPSKLFKPISDSLKQLSEEKRFEWEEKFGFYSQKQRNHDLYQKLNKPEGTEQYDVILEENKDLIEFYDDIPFIREDFYTSITNLDGLFVVDS